MLTNRCGTFSNEFSIPFVASAGVGICAKRVLGLVLTEVSILLSNEDVFENSSSSDNGSVGNVDPSVI